MPGMSQRYSEVVDRLRESYDARAAHRDRVGRTPWKLAEREAFLGRLRERGCRRLLEVGAGPGHDSRYFAEQGLVVAATDLSPAMVALCRGKGIDAHVMDFLHLDFPAGSFDAVYALNCLLHVPDADLPEVLRAIHRLLRPGGLFFLGVYGGEDREGSWDEDAHDPPRFFAFRTDERIQAYATEVFDLLDFHTIEADGDHFQSLTLLRSVTG
jgi:SAM-dependent methyltransferase